MINVVVPWAIKLEQVLRDAATHDHRDNLMLIIEAGNVKIDARNKVGNNFVVVLF